MPSRPYSALDFLLCLSQALLLGACASRVDLNEFREEMLRTQSSFRADLADMRNSAKENQREIEVVKGQIDELRHLIQTQPDPAQESKRISATEKTTAEQREQVRSLEEDLKKTREELRVQRDEITSLRAAVGRLVDRSSATSQGQSPTNPCDLAQAEISQLPEGYQNALRRMCRQDFRGAIAGFREFQSKFPKSDLADHAQYWIGECYYAMKEYERAILEFQEVLRKSPKSSRVPAALLKQGLSFYELGHREDARLVLEKLVQDYPATGEAETARIKLASIPK